jgi:hypothetical protein
MIAGSDMYEVFSHIDSVHYWPAHQESVQRTDLLRMCSGR